MVVPELWLRFVDVIRLWRTAAWVSVTAVSVPSVGSNSCKAGASGWFWKFVSTVSFAGLPMVSVCGVVVTGVLAVALILPVESSI